MTTKNALVSFVMALIDIFVSAGIFSPTPMQLLMLFIYNFGITFILLIIVEWFVVWLIEFVTDIYYRIRQKMAEHRESNENKALIQSL